MKYEGRQAPQELTMRRIRAMRQLVMVALISCAGCGDERSPSPIHPTPPAQPMPPQPTPPADSLPNLAGDYTITFMAKGDGGLLGPCCRRNSGHERTRRGSNRTAEELRGSRPGW